MGLFSSSKSAATDQRTAGGADDSRTAGANARYLEGGAQDFNVAGVGNVIDASGQDAPEVLDAAGRIVAGALTGPLDFARDAAAGAMKTQIRLAELNAEAQERATNAAVVSANYAIEGAQQAAELAVGRQVAPDWSTLVLYGVAAWVLISIFGK